MLRVHSHYFYGTLCTPLGIGSGGMRTLDPEVPARLKWIGLSASAAGEPTLAPQNTRAR